jgi:hypothetical protein
MRLSSLPRSSDMPCAVLVDTPKNISFLEQPMHGINNNGVGNSARTLLVDGVHILL